MASKGTQTPKSLAIAEAGIKTSGDFRNFMSSVMSDVIAGRVTASITNAACNAGGKLLKMVDLEYKYGTDPERGKGSRTLSIAFEEPSPAAALPASPVAEEKPPQKAKGRRRTAA